MRRPRWAHCRARSPDTPSTPPQEQEQRAGHQRDQEQAHPPDHQGGDDDGGVHGIVLGQHDRHGGVERAPL